MWAHSTAGHWVRLMVDQRAVKKADYSAVLKVAHWVDLMVDRRVDQRAVKMADYSAVQMVGLTVGM